MTNFTEFAYTRYTISSHTIYIIFENRFFLGGEFLAHCVYIFLHHFNYFHICYNYTNFWFLNGNDTFLRNRFLREMLKFDMRFPSKKHLCLRHHKTKKYFIENIENVPTWRRFIRHF